MPLKIVLIGAGSQEFGPASIRDVLLSEILARRDIHLVLMDKNATELPGHLRYARDIAARLGRQTHLSATTDLSEALEGADFVISAIEVRRYFYWSQDFHIPRKYGFRQIYGENGGPGGLFHALRNFAPMEEIVRAMEVHCPEAWLLNYTNPLTKICQMLTQNTAIRVVGLCHGVFMGKSQIARLLGLPVADLDALASGLNHFSWFHQIRHATSGEDLYPRLKEAERRAHWLAEWDEIALSRILFRAFGLYPSPGANHIGEYIRWAPEFLASDRLQYFYDPREKDPWKNGPVPTFVYNLDARPTETPLQPAGHLQALYQVRPPEDPEAILPSGELAIPIIEGLAGGATHHLAAVNIPNRGALVPGLPENAVVEVPATVDSTGLHPLAAPALPEGPLALLRTQCSIHQLLVDAYRRNSRDVLLQAMLLDPMVNSYPNAVHVIDEMFTLQEKVLPPLRWEGA